MVVTTTATTASEPSSFRFMSQKNKEIVLKNVENWKRERVERVRVKKARTERKSFNEGFGSLSELLSR